MHQVIGVDRMTRALIATIVGKSFLSSLIPTTRVPLGGYYWPRTPGSTIEKRDHFGREMQWDSGKDDRDGHCEI